MQEVSNNNAGARTCKEVKEKFTIEQATKAQRGRRGIALHIP